MQAALSFPGRWRVGRVPGLQYTAIRNLEPTVAKVLYWLCDTSKHGIVSSCAFLKRYESFRSRCVYHCDVESGSTARTCP